MNSFKFFFCDFHMLFQNKYQRNKIIDKRDGKKIFWKPIKIPRLSFPFSNIHRIFKNWKKKSDKSRKTLLFLAFFFIIKFHLKSWQINRNLIRKILRDLKISKFYERMKNQTYEINRTFIRERISKFLSFLILSIFDRRNRHEMKIFMDESLKIFLTKIKKYLQRGVVQRRLNLVRHRQHHRVLREFIHRLFRAWGQNWRWSFDREQTFFEIQKFFHFVEIPFHV